MNIEEATKRLAALSQQTRLKVFRLLAAAGPQGLPAGEIARRLEVLPATLSFHLSHLEEAGLLVSRRQSRSIIYSIDVAGMRALLGFLTDDCCGGNPEICLPGEVRMKSPLPKKAG